MLCIRTSILTTLILLAARAVLWAGDEPKFRTAVTGDGTIFLAEVTAAQHSQGCAEFWRLHMRTECNTKVHVRVVRIYKRRKDADPAPPLEFDTDIRQRREGFGGPAPWQNQETAIQAGQRYLLFDAIGKDFPVIFAGAYVPLLLSDQEDAVGDVELLLNCESLTLGQQASAVATAIEGATVPHTHLLAEYVPQLLAAGSDSETGTLAEALEHRAADAFSPRGRAELLAALARLSQSGATGPDNLVRAYVNVTVRYFFLKPNEVTPLEPDMHDVILRHVAMILEHDRAMTILRRTVSPPLLQDFVKKVMEAASDARLEESRRVPLRQFAAVIGRQ
jgi:hypothetical protein